MDETQKKQLKTNIRVGFLFLLVIIIIMIALFLIKSKTDLLEQYFTFSITFPHVQGLKLGAPVQLAGVRIGEVTDIKFPDEIGQQHVIVTVKVKKSAQARLRKDVFIYIDSPSLLSEKNVQITFGTAGGDPIKEGDNLMGLPEKP